MGRLLLISRLAIRDTRRHLAQAILLLVAVTAATTVLTLGLALTGVTNSPYQQTRAATKGPDVVATLSDPAQASSLAHAGGVTGYSGPFPQLDAVVQLHGITAGVEAEGRTQAPAAVDQPKVLAGTWVQPGGVVIEREFADALGARVGDHLTINGHPFTVDGIAVTAATAPYPNICYSGCYINAFWYSQGITAKKIGLIWMTEPDVTALATKANPMSGYILNLRLAQPAQAAAFVNQNNSNANNAPLLTSWQQIASADALLISDEQSVLTPGAILLGLLALASVAVLVGGRLAESRRRVGLLKAAGGTPALIGVTFLAANLILALLAAAIGLAAGRLAAPLLTSPGAALVGSPGAPAITGAMVAGVVAVALVVALASTLVPAIRAARSSTISALNDAARPVRRHSKLISFSSRLPVAALFGLRLAARRPRRTLLSAAGIAVTVCGIVAMLTFHAAVNAEIHGTTTAGTGLANPVVGRDGQMLVVITVVLAILAAITAIFTAWATVLDARRASALMRALGATSRQVSAGMAWAQVLAALPGAIIGIPLGIGLFDVLSKGATGFPQAEWLVITFIGTLLVVAGLTTIPARIASRVSPSAVLQGTAD
jgi:putative ABC transport system permease protein